MTNEVSKEVYQTGLTRISNSFMPQIESQLEGNGIEMTDYQKMCVLGAIQSIDTAVKKGKGWDQTDKSNVSNVLMTIAALQLNATAVPREVYFITRNTKVAGNWVSQIEMGIEGDGNDAILSKFGRNVKRVHRFWEVREKDEFTYPGYKGLERTDPTWQPTGEGKVIRIVYPVEMTDGSIEFHISERRDVVRNLIAHINSNLMNETFGIVTGTKNAYGKQVPRTRYDATAEEKKKIDARKKELLAKLEDRELEELIADPEFESYISPAWKSPQSRESMIVRKMRNNVTKKIPKDFGNAYVAMKYQEQDDDVTTRVRKDVTEQTASEEYDFDEPEETAEQESTRIEEKEEPEQKQAEVRKREKTIAEEVEEAYDGDFEEIKDEPESETASEQPSLFDEPKEEKKKRPF